MQRGAGLRCSEVWYADAEMVWFSYHGGHSGQFCRHAKGQLHEVVQAALSGGFTTFGLSEHCPRRQPEHLYPEEADLSPKDLFERFAEYQRTAARLRERYEGRLEVLVGFETEALPVDGWRELMGELRQSAPFDYIVGSVHSVRGTWIDFSPEVSARAAEECGGRDALDCEYFEQLAELITALRPEVVGHVDLIRKFRGQDVGFCERARSRIDEVLRAAREVGAALEVNAAPARRQLGPVYPSLEILRRAKELDVRVTLGDDSHGPAEVGVALEASRDAIAAAGYEHVHYLTCREGGVVFEAAPIREVRPRAVPGVA